MEITDVSESDVLKIGFENDAVKSSLNQICEDDQLELIFKALSSKTRRDILREIQSGPKDVSDIAGILDMTEANISAQIKKLEEANLITCEYSSGLHGVRKVSQVKYKIIHMSF
ncbi:MAG: metalloregulator ArsR/SmtB family transcription factor [Candidatus Lokiarchaeota archaeon]